jgi:hypothetical protein
MRFSMTLSLVLGSALALAAACSSPTPAPIEPVATSSAATDMAEPEPTAVPTASAVATPTMTATATPTMTASATATASAPPPKKKTWMDFNHDEKMAFMKAEVMPKMAKTWGDFDKKYAKMDCATCHGSSAKKGQFKMPNAELPKLDHKDNLKAHKGKQKVLDFMFKMTPELAGILSLPPFDPASGQGFGCGGCHVMKK